MTNIGRCANGLRVMLSDLRESVAQLLDDTENNLKLIEDYSGDFFVPILNEWRYATRHVIDSYFEPQNEATLQKIINHLKRARFDSYGMLLTLQLDHIRKLRLAVGGYSGIVQKHVSDWTEWQLKIQDAFKLFDSQPRGGDKDEFHDQIKLVCTGLQEYIRILEATQPSWASEIARERRKDLWQMIVFLSTILATVVAIIGMFVK